MGRRRAAAPRLSRRRVSRQRHASGRVWQRPRCAGSTDAHHLRPLRRAAARSARRMDQPTLRANDPRRQDLRARHGRRQGSGLLPAQGDRRVRADAVLVADMSYVAPAWPAVYTTLRGLCYAEITVRTSKTDLHSGEYGGAAPNAHEELCRLLTRLKGQDGKINIPGFYAPVKRPPKAELAAWKKLPFTEKDFLQKRVQGKALVGLKKYSVLERLWALPTFEIHGILGGFTGEGAKTVIPAEATAKVSMRLVPNQKLGTVERQLAAAVKRVAPKHVTASVRFLHGANPAQIKIDHPAFRLLDQAFKQVTGRGTVPARAGGSIPVVPALASAGAPVILTGIGLPDDRLHAPNEKLDLKQLWDGIEVFS